MHAARAEGGFQSLVHGPEHDAVHGDEGPLEAADRVAAEVAVVGDAARDHRVRNLHQGRRRSRELEGVLAQVAPARRAGSEESRRRIPHRLDEVVQVGRQVAQVCRQAVGVHGRYGSRTTRTAGGRRALSRPGR